MRERRHSGSAARRTPTRDIVQVQTRRQLRSHASDFALPLAVIEKTSRRAARRSQASSFLRVYLAAASPRSDLEYSYKQTQGLLL